MLPVLHYISFGNCFVKSQQSVKGHVETNLFNKDQKYLVKEIPQIYKGKKEPNLKTYNTVTYTRLKN